MITIEHAGCIFCVGCSSVCPANAIEAVGTRMKHYPEKCIDCGLCAKVCPANVITLHKGVKDPCQAKAHQGHAAPKGAVK